MSAAAAVTVHSASPHRLAQLHGLHTGPLLAGPAGPDVCSCVQLRAAVHPAAPVPVLTHLWLLALAQARQRRLACGPPPGRDGEQGVVHCCW